MHDDDAEGLIALVGSAYAEYPGCVLDLPGVDADLLRPATTAAARGGRWWVVEDDGGPVATVGAGALRPDGHVELKRLYVAASHRRRGLGARLLGWVEAHASGLGARHVDLWSDTRFADAHRRYASLGYVATGEMRDLDDPSDTTEFRFSRSIAPAPPRRTVTWTGRFEADTCHLVDLPDGALLYGEVAGVAAYRVEVDARWGTRVAEVSGAGRRLTSDGLGRWWADGQIVRGLAGCTDVDLEVTPATNALPIRRAGAALAPGDTTTVRAAWVRSTGAVEPSEQRYQRIDEERWRFRSGGFEAELTVDADGLPTRYGDLWRRETDGEHPVEVDDVDTGPDR